MDPRPEPANNDDRLFTSKWTDEDEKLFEKQCEEMAHDEMTQSSARSCTVM